ncbi:MAG: nucleotidyltransferase domain-containing protein [bacterium]|nr:MAG: nucleotidyltransferase domain-containing protein [bacterium]
MMGVDSFLKYQKQKEQKRQQSLARENQKRSQVINRIRAVLEQNKIEGICYLYGSTAEGCANPGSDIDIAIEGIPYDRYFKLWALLNDEIDGYFIDLRDITGQSNFFAQKVRKYGKIIHRK